MSRCRRWMDSQLCVRYTESAIRQSLCLRHALRLLIAYTAWMEAQMITSVSPAIRMSCYRGSVPSYGAQTAPIEDTHFALVLTASTQKAENLSSTVIR